MQQPSTTSPIAPFSLHPTASAKLRIDSTTASSLEGGAIVNVVVEGNPIIPQSRDRPETKNSTEGKKSHHLELLKKDAEEGSGEDVEGQKRVYKEKRRANARSYLKQTFLAHFIVLIVAIGIETLFLDLCTNVTAFSPYVTVYLASDELKIAQERVSFTQNQHPHDATAVHAAEDGLRSQVETFKSVVGKARKDGWQIFKYEAIFTLLGVLPLFVIAALVYRHRNHAVVKSCGRLYLVLLFTVGSLNIITTLFMSSSYLFVFNEFPLDLDYSKPEVLNIQKTYTANIVFATFTIVIFLVSSFFSVLALRQRIIAHVFNNRSPSMRLHNRTLLMWALGWTLLSFSICMPSYVVWRVVDYHHPRGTRYGVAGLVGLGLVYAPLSGYYLLKASPASIRFNDMYANLRTLGVTIIAYMVLMLFNQFKPYHTISACVGWSSMVRFSVAVQALDQFCTQALQARWEVPARPPVLQLVSYKTTRKGWLNWSVWGDQRPAEMNSSTHHEANEQNLQIKPEGPTSHTEESQPTAQCDV